MAIAAVALAVLPVAVATIRALLRHQLPVGDNALIAIRAADVGTEHHPLLGMWSSASVAAETELHHPGPLFLDLLALPVRVLGPEGVALGVGLVNILSIVGIALVARRRGGPSLMALAALIAAALSWSMGSQLLVEPWQPHATLLPFLLFLMLVWSATCGDTAALPWAAAVGSLVLQTHLSYSLLVPVLGGWAVLWLVLERHRKSDSEDSRRQVKRSLAITGAVLALCWVQPLWEQFTGSGSGNLSGLASSVGGDTGTIGFGLAARLMASVLVLPAWWLKPSFKDAWLSSSFDFQPEGSNLPSFAVASACLFLLGGILAFLWWLVVSRRDRDGRQGVATAVVALGVGLITAAIVPAGVFGIAPHQFRWLWPLAAFATFAVLTILDRIRGDVAAWRRWIDGTALGITAVLAAANLPAGEESPASPADAIEIATELGSRLGPLREEAPLRVELPERFNDPYATAIMAELQHRDIPFVIEPSLAIQLGDDRVDDGRARAVLTVGFGEDPVPPPGGRRFALHRSVAIFVTPLD